MKVRKAVLDTGLFADHLRGPAEGSTALRRALRSWFCYTTVFNAMELFRGARSAGDRRAVEGALSAVKILGMNGRNAGRFARLMPSGGGRLPATALIAGICIEARLPLVTDRPEAFRDYKELRVLRPPRAATTR